jgi:hypothetical protein
MQESTACKYAHIVAPHMHIPYLHIHLLAKVTCNHKSVLKTLLRSFLMDAECQKIQISQSRFLTEVEPVNLFMAYLV